MTNEALEKKKPEYNFNQHLVEHLLKLFGLQFPRLMNVNCNF